MGRASPDESPHESEVAIPSAGVRLAATLALPAGTGPHPGALLLPGSGPLDRDGDNPRLRTGISAAIAAALNHRGIATLRFDKRGVGGSPGDWRRAGFADRLADARAALGWLQTQHGIQEPLTVAVGHSEGAWLICGLGGTAEAERLAAAVLLSPSAQPGREVLLWQAQRQTETMPAWAARPLSRLGLDPERRRRRALKRIRGSTADVIRVGGRRVPARWFREMEEFDPRVGLSRLTCPILAVGGGKDLQADPADLDRLAGLSAGAVETVLVPDLTHVLRRDERPPRLSAYRRLLRRPPDATVVDLVADWIAAHVNPRASRSSSPSG
jgi:pimeloyl-ACP methyl ester carboxylesterase